MVTINLKFFLAFTVVLCLCASRAQAQTPELDALLNETLWPVPKAGLVSIELETTLYKPDGDGPFPIAIINHGKSSGDSRFQERYRPAMAARFFLERGYAVVVPMRQGFSKSGGNFTAGCDIESNGRAQAEDVKAVLDYVTAQPWADKHNIVMLGQSYGGWTTLAFGPNHYPGVKALVNFAGGLRQSGCLAWEGGLIQGAAKYARETSLPSLWFYGDNDSFFTTATFNAMFDQYTAAGGRARLVAFGKFGTDAHGMFGSRGGAPIWQPEVARLLATVGLPSEPRPAFARYGTAGLVPLPATTNFASLDDDTRVPYLQEAGRQGYKAYLSKVAPRAFAIGLDGAWSWAEDGEDPLRRALDSCKRFSKADCKLYSVDDAVVWAEAM